VSLSQLIWPHAFAWAGQLLLGVVTDYHRTHSSRHPSTNWSGLKLPLAFSRLMMARTPGSDGSPIFSAQKLTRAIREPLLIHSLPVCHPSTDGG